MSPRRKLPPDDEPSFPLWRPRPRRRWGLLLAETAATAMAAASIALCALVLYDHQLQRRSDILDVEALGYVRSFMTEFTSPDPFHANNYADRILAQATGDFAEYYRQHENEILVGVARSEPTTGAVLEAAVSRRNDDGSVDIMVVTTLTAKSSDGALQLQRVNRWVVTTKQEGERWKISNLNPMM
ncbi:mammalian cell entry protein [Mycolicibacterium sp.]|uniref:mammalian cell entry protein n=1 Tax=Mycolicibacterium sp. TaxID=2320850 RepID=UPI0037CAE91D